MDWLKMSSRREAGWTVVGVIGELDIASGTQLGDHLEEVIAKDDPPRVVLDMSRLDFCDASGLSVLAAAQHAALRGNGQLRLVCPQSRFRRLLRITELTDVIPVFDTVTQATSAEKERVS